MKALLYVVNIAAPVKVELAGIEFVLIPLVQGLPWNEAIDELVRLRPAELLIEDEGLALRGSFVIDPDGILNPGKIFPPG